MSDDVRSELLTLLPRLRRFAYSLCGTIDQADDLVQSACEKALTRLDQFEPGTRLDSWMFRIVQTTWIDEVRSYRRRRTESDEEAILAFADDARIEERTAARSELDVVRAEIQKLPEEQRVVLSLVSIDGASYAQAAAILDIPIGTVMSRLARARRKLTSAITFLESNARSQEREIYR